MKRIVQIISVVLASGGFMLADFPTPAHSPDVRAASQERTATGAELFAQNCSRCHGETGHGGRGPDLTSPKRQEKWKDSDEKIVNKITNGGFIMPSFRKKLSAEQIQSIADFVRTLKP